MLSSCLLSHSDDVNSDDDSDEFFDDDSVKFSDDEDAAAEDRLEVLLLDDDSLRFFGVLDSPRNKPYVWTCLLDVLTGIITRPLHREHIQRRTVMLQPEGRNLKF